MAADRINYEDVSGVKVDWKAVANEDGITQADAERQAFKLLQSVRALRQMVPQVLEIVLKTPEEIKADEDARAEKKRKLKEKKDENESPKLHRGDKNPVRGNPPGGV